MTTYNLLLPIRQAVQQLDDENVSQEQAIINLELAFAALQEGINNGTIGKPMAYRHEQAIPASVWTVVHNLNAYPNVTVVDSARTVKQSDISYPDTNTVVITNGAPFGGWAYLS